MFTIISFFQKLIKGGVGIRAGGGLENFSKINKRGGDDYSVLESIHFHTRGSIEWRKSFYRNCAHSKILQNVTKYRSILTLFRTKRSI